MIDKYFSPGVKVEIHPIVKGENQKVGRNKIYISQINQVIDEDKIEIMMPIDQGKLILLPINSLCKMVSITSNGLFECNIKITDRYKSGNVYLQLVEMVTPIKKYQRREYYRYSCSVPITTRKLEESEKIKMNWDHDLPGIPATALDIGGGGLRFLTDVFYETGEDIVCCLRLETLGVTKEIQALGRVLSSREITRGNDKREVRVQFEVISNSAREEIIQFIFEDERRRRKNNSWH
ncbi:MAG: flagellar brake protein [Lachnospiraceae bacterium]|nr:flagellar brake protein [Lachnospiraceae bacterium]